MKRASYSCCNFLCIVLAAAYLKYRLCRLSCLPFVWHPFFHCDTHTHTHTHIHTYTHLFFFFSLAQINFALKAQIHTRTHTHAHTRTHTRTHTHTHTNTHTVFVSTDGRRACRRGAIGSTIGAYPRDTGSNPVKGNGHFFPDTGSNPVKGNGHFFPSYRQLYLSSFSDTHTHTHTRTHAHV